MRSLDNIVTKLSRGKTFRQSWKQSWHNHPYDQLLIASTPRFGVWCFSPGESLGSVPNRRWPLWRLNVEVLLRSYQSVLVAVLDGASGAGRCLTRDRPSDATYSPSFRYSWVDGALIRALGKSWWCVVLEAFCVSRDAVLSFSLGKRFWPGAPLTWHATFFV